jgi:hypothetical protein
MVPIQKEIIKCGEKRFRTGLPAVFEALFSQRVPETPDGRNCFLEGGRKTRCPLLQMTVSETGGIHRHQLVFRPGSCLDLSLFRYYRYCESGSAKKPIPPGNFFVLVKFLVVWGDCTISDGMTTLKS